MSKESYARGFCKAAEAHGVDPMALAKYAQQIYPHAKPGPTMVQARAQELKDLRTDGRERVDMFKTLTGLPLRAPDMFFGGYPNKFKGNKRDLYNRLIVTNDGKPLLKDLYPGK